MIFGTQGWLRFVPLSITEERILINRGFKRWSDIDFLVIPNHFVALKYTHASWKE